MSAGKAAAIIRILSTPGQRDSHFLAWVVTRIERGAAVRVSEEPPKP